MRIVSSMLFSLILLFAATAARADYQQLGNGAFTNYVALGGGGIQAAVVNNSSMALGYNLPGLSVTWATPHPGETLTAVTKSMVGYVEVTHSSACTTARVSVGNVDMVGCPLSFTGYDNEISGSSSAQIGYIIKSPGSSCTEDPVDLNGTDYTWISPSTVYSFGMGSNTVLCLARRHLNGMSPTLMSPSAKITKYVFTCGSPSSSSLVTDACS